MPNMFDYFLCVRLEQSLPYTCTTSGLYLYNLRLILVQPLTNACTSDVERLYE